MKRKLLARFAADSLPIRRLEVVDRRYRSALARTALPERVKVTRPGLRRNRAASVRRSGADLALTVQVPLSAAARPAYHPSEL